MTFLQDVHEYESIFVKHGAYHIDSQHFTLPHVLPFDGTYI